MVNLRPFADKRPIGPLNEVVGESKDDANNLTLEDLYGPNVDKVNVHFHTSADMRELQNDSVALTVTSPPYNFGWEYNSVSDEKKYVSEYLAMLANVFEEVYRVTMPEGRLAVNVPTIDKQSNKGDEGHISIASDVISMLTTQQSLFGAHGVTSNDINRMQKNSDWVLEDHIIRSRGKQTNRPSYKLGSLGSGYPFRFPLEDTQDSILLFKKPGKRDVRGIRQEIKDASEVDKSFYAYEGGEPLCATLPKDNMWTLPPDRVIEGNGERVPTFPEEIPRRLIKGYSYMGDTILDPFAGAGTTLKVAKELDRLSTGYELRPELRPLIERRVGENI